MTTPTNILIVITDQQTAEAMSCTGNQWLQTPAMDRLAARGTRLTRAYCSYPLCAPARTSHLTGRYPHEYGILGNLGKPFWAAGIPREDLLGYHFSRAGYRCVWAGKDMPPADGSRDFELLCQWGDVQVADHLTAFLRDPGDQPFLGIVNFVNPHNICEWAREMPLWESGIGPVPPDEELPPLPANHGVPPYEPEIIREIQQWGMENFLPRNYTPLQWQRYLWAYYRLIELVDEQIARITDALDETGLAEDTLVIFMADHGDGCGAHQWNQKMVLYEEAIRVPMILAGPGIAPGRISDKLVSTGLDLFPTCCKEAGIPVANGLTGRNLLELCGGAEPDDWRDALVVTSALNPEIGNDQKMQKRNRGRAVLTERWKYSVWSWGQNREQLVDLQTDPGEMVNLAVSCRYAPQRDHLRQRLHDWCRATGDAFQVPGHEILSPGAIR